MNHLYDDSSKNQITVDINSVEGINTLIQYNQSLNPDFKENDISDGYHTFNELYEFRKMYNAALFNEWGIPVTCHTPTEDIIFERPKHSVHKSWKHNDGELCFGGGWFIVSAMLPTGQISNHYKAEDWPLFKVPEVEKALFPFDGHTGKDVLQRLKDLYV
jgi:hypothetical protein